MKSRKNTIVPCCMLAAISPRPTSSAFCEFRGASRHIEARTGFQLRRGEGGHGPTPHWRTCLSDWLQLLDRIRAPSEDTARQIGLEAVATVPRNAAAQRARP